MTIAILLEALFGFGVAAGFVIIYGTRYRWSRTSMGRHIMSMTFVIGLLLGMIITGRVLVAVTDGQVRGLPVWAWALGLALLDSVLVWRLVLLVARPHNSDDHKEVHHG